MRVVTILSGGLDSTVLLYSLRSDDQEVFALSFDYGQRHHKELDCARTTCAVLGVPQHFVDLTTLQNILTSSLTFHSAVPEGHYAQESMRATIVPNRNAIMLSVAYGFAVSVGASTVFFGAHAGDHEVYPDCRENFVHSLSLSLQTGNQWADPVPTIEAPFLHVTKADIVRLGAILRVPFEDTWSCYQGLDLHCGKCGTCVERQEAFAKEGLTDPIQYVDSNYWKTVTAHAS